MANIDARCRYIGNENLPNKYWSPKDWYNSEKRIGILKKSGFFVENSFFFTETFGNVRIYTLGDI